MADHEQRALLCCTCIVRREVAPRSLRRNAAQSDAASSGRSCCLVSAQPLSQADTSGLCGVFARAIPDMHASAPLSCTAQYWGAAWELAQAPQGPLNLRVTDDKGNQVSGSPHKESTQRLRHVPTSSMHERFSNNSVSLGHQASLAAKPR